VDCTVAPEHARIERKAGRVFCTALVGDEDDLFSDTYTWVDGNQIRKGWWCLNAIVCDCYVPKLKFASMHWQRRDTCAEWVCSYVQGLLTCFPQGPTSHLVGSCFVVI
jgi:hypothetical protein